MVVVVVVVVVVLGAVALFCVWRLAEAERRAVGEVERLLRVQSEAIVGAVMATFGPRSSEGEVVPEVRVERLPWFLRTDGGVGTDPTDVEDPWEGEVGRVASVPPGEFKLWEEEEQ